MSKWVWMMHRPNREIKVSQVFSLFRPAFHAQCSEKSIKKQIISKVEASSDSQSHENASNRSRADLGSGDEIAISLQPERLRCMFSPFDIVGSSPASAENEQITFFRGKQTWSTSKNRFLLPSVRNWITEEFFWFIIAEESCSCAKILTTKSSPAS